MRKIEDLKIYIVDSNIETYYELDKEFDNIKNVKISCDYIQEFYLKHSSEIDCLVSPANAFGYMTGGYDAALSDILGWGFQKKVQAYIKEHYYGEQPVSSSFIIDTDIKGLKLIHTPSMQYPSLIVDDMVIYHCTRSAIICALENDIKCLVLPAFGGDSGGVSGYIVAQRMKEAYIQIRDKKEAVYVF